MAKLENISSGDSITANVDDPMGLTLSSKPHCDWKMFSGKDNVLKDQMLKLKRSCKVLFSL